MKKIISFIVDGSICNDLETKKKKKAVGWAIVINNGFEEVYGALEWNKELAGYHEHVSLIHGVLLALARKYSPEQCIFYTDAQILSEINFHFHEENRSPVASVLKMQLENTLVALGLENCKEDLFDFLKSTQVKKIRSHSKLAAQERADYLARTCARQFVGSLEPLMDYDSWLKKGIEVREGDTVCYWNFPFTHDYK